MDTPQPGRARRSCWDVHRRDHEGMSGRAKAPFGDRFGRKMVAIIGKIAVNANVFPPSRLLPRTVQSRRRLSEMATGVGYLSTR